MPTVTMTYGDFEFSPVPFINLTKNMVKSGDDRIIGTTFECTLEGTLTPLPDGGLSQIDDLQDGLREAFNAEGLLLEVKCGTGIILQAYPRVSSINFPPSSNNWVYTSPYTITLAWEKDDLAEDTGVMPPYVKSVSESWGIEQDDSQSFYHWAPNGQEDKGPLPWRVTHNLSATGKRSYTGVGTVASEAWEQAQTWVLARLGWTPSDTEGAMLTGPKILGSHGVINLTSGDYTAYNHMRTKTIDEAGGAFSVTESWIAVLSSGVGWNGPAVEDFNISVKQGIDSDFTTVSVQGSIQGLEERTYGSNPGDFTIPSGSTKYDNAKTAWGIIESKLYHRARQVADPLATRTLNTIAVSKTVSHSPVKGAISYGYDYNDRPCNIISGSLSEVLTISDTNPTDVFASHVVLGRANGPILQSLSTVTASIREVSFEVVMAPYAGCDSCTSMRTEAPRTTVQTALCCFETELTSSYSQVFKTADRESWNPKIGRYSRNIAWTYVNCTGTPPSTSLC